MTPPWCGPLPWPGERCAPHPRLDFGVGCDDQCLDRATVLFAWGGWPMSAARARVAEMDAAKCARGARRCG